MLPRDPRIEFWTCFLEVRGFEFGRASQRSDGLKFGRASQRSVDLNLDVLPRGPRIEFWTCFPEVRWILAHAFKGLRIFWALAHVFRGPKVLDPGSYFQRPRIFRSWLMFSED